MNDWIFVLGAAYMLLILAIMMLPSWLLERDEKREEAEAARRNSRAVPGGTSE